MTSAQGSHMAKSGPASSYAKFTDMYIHYSTQSSAHTPWLDFVYHIIEKKTTIVLIGSNIEDCESVKCP